MRSTKFQIFLVAGFTGGLGFYGCSAPGPATEGTGGSTGGTVSSGGTQTTGGASNGGQVVATGGTVGTGGSFSTGGSVASTGGNAAGGTVTMTGGAQATGGTQPTGGGFATGGSTTGGTGQGGSANTGGAVTGTGGSKASGGSSTGGSSTGGTNGNGGSSTGGSSTGGTGTGTRSDGPCDIYAAASTPCVAAYSMIRALTKTYTGPLYQVRSGSSASNTGTGGTLKDIGMTADGFADSASQDAFCSGTVCTVAKLYDQSGNGNHIGVAKKGLSNGGATAAMDDFESSATKGKLKVNGHNVYSLYMAAREGYRLPAVGKNMPRGTAAQGIYMLADGTHYGTACCWDFGNVTTDPTKYGVMNTLFFGVAYWGNGAGAGPWFMADFEAGVWAGGSKAGDPGWGALDGAHPSNPNNPSMKVPFALGILKTTPSNYTLRSGNGQSGTLTTSYDGALPKAMDNLGGIVLGVGGDNSNNSWGTFFEGAITAGAPSAATDAAVLSNVQAAKYGQ